MPTMLSLKVRRAFREQLKRLDRIYRKYRKMVRSFISPQHFIIVRNHNLRSGIPMTHY